MKRFLIALAVVGLLAGCAGSTETRATNALAIACDSHAKLLRELAPYKAKMSKGTVLVVDRSRDLVRPVCSKESAVIDPKTAVGIVNSGITLLKDLKSKF